ncbi:MAG TPA: DUF3795 domain-containing protein [Anaerolineaceae bacterium]|nr:DUF3795 domain-containing protein [Anaerolineaceae bacterium]
MNVTIAACGLDCGNCKAYLATQAGDLEAIEQIAAEGRATFNNPAIDAAYVMCDGCASMSGRLGGYCGECAVRACCLQRGYANCAQCPDYACTELAGLLAQIPEARARLEAIRF